MENNTIKEIEIKFYKYATKIMESSPEETSKFQTKWDSSDYKGAYVLFADYVLQNMDRSVFEHPDNSNFYWTFMR